MDIKKLLSGLILVSVLFVGCGGGSSSSSGDSAVVTVNNLPTQIDVNTTFDGNLTITNVGSTTYVYTIENNVSTVVKTSSMNDVGNDNIFIVDINMSGVTEGNYTFNSTVTGTDGVDKNITHAFYIGNYTPIWTASSYATGITVRDNTNSAITTKDLTAISSDAENDTITYSIVSINVPHSNDQTAWNNSVYIESGVLKVHNLTTNDPDIDGTVTVTIKATATGGSNNTTISFEYLNFN